MQNSNKVVFIGKGNIAQQGLSQRSSASSLSHAHQGLVDRLREHIHGQILPLISSMFDTLDDDLYKLAENSGNNSTQTSYFDAMRSLRVLRQGMEKSYLAVVQENFDLFWQSGGQDGLLPKVDEARKPGELSLVAEDDLEEELATSTMIAKGNNRLHRDLFAMNKRFSSMLGTASVNDSSNPLSPNALVRLFQRELGSWDGDIMVRIVVYKLFDKHVLSGIKEIYEEINQLLINAGILPDIHQQVGYGSGGHSRAGSVKPVAESADASASKAVAQPSQSADVAEVPSLPQIWSFMQQMMAVQQSELGLFRAGLAETAHLPEAPHKIVFEELDDLQHQAQGLPEQWSLDLKSAQEELRNLLASRLGRMQDGVQTQRLSLADQQAIDVIMLLFSEMLDDSELPDAMRAMLARLQIPVLKAAVADPSFVHDKQHPARVLLNNLAKASLGWTEDSDRSENSLYGRIKASVDRILNEFSDDISLFSKVNEELMAFQQEAARRAAVVEKRVTEVVEGEDKMDASRNRIDELYARLDIGNLPEVAKNLLNDPWKNLLTIVLLREGEQSAEWKEFVETAEELVASVLPGDAGLSRSQLLAAIPRLGNRLRKGFSYISYSQNDTRRILNELQICHIGAVRSKSNGASAPVQTKPIQVVSPVVEKVEPQDQGDQHTQTVRDIAEGHWVRMQKDGREITGKLVWRSKFTGTMLFVDGQGRKVAQIKEKELAELFRCDHAGLLRETNIPLIDRAFGRMMMFMKNAMSPGKHGEQAILA